MLEHHAYLCKLSSVDEGGVQSAAAQLQCEEVVFLTYQNFGIDDVRSLTEKAFMRPVMGSQQLLVVSFSTITVEAQQALLKLLEEPPQGTAFLFCIPESLYVLPTVLSRFNELSAVPREVKPVTAFTYFLSQSLSERIADISLRLARKDKEPDWPQEIKAGLIEHLKEHSRRYQGADLETLAFIAEHLLTRGAANKYLLEELAFTLEKAAEKP